jgi:hypothetical protein
MKSVNDFLNEETIKGGSTIKPDSEYDSEELAKGIEIEMEHTDDEAIATEIAKDHLTEIPDYYSRLIDMENDAEDNSIEIDIELDIPDVDNLDEARFIRTQRMKDSSAVISATSNKLFGPNGSKRAMVDKLFMMFKKEAKNTAREMNIPIGNVQQWKLVLRDYSDKKDKK